MNGKNPESSFIKNTNIGNKKRLPIGKPFSTFKLNLSSLDFVPGLGLKARHSMGLETVSCSHLQPYLDP